MIKDPFNGWPAPTKVQHRAQHTLKLSVVSLLQSLYKMKMLNSKPGLCTDFKHIYTLCQPTQVV